MRARFCEGRLCQRLLQLKPDAHLLHLRRLPSQACGKGWNFPSLPAQSSLLVALFCDASSNTHSVNLQKHCLVNFRLLCQRSSPDFSENENHLLGSIAL
jgi:hypothetical protein